DVPGHVAVHLRAVTQLAVIVAAPALHRAGRGQRAAVGPAGGDLGHALAEPLHRPRDGAVVVAAVAQLAGIVLTPAQGGAAFHRTGVAAAHAHGLHAAVHAGDGDGKGVGGQVAVAELAGQAIAPAAQGTAGQRGAGVVAAGGHR